MHIDKNIRDTVDAGTSERAQRQGGITIGARIQTEGGIVTHHGAMAKNECLLDSLFNGDLLNGTEGTKQDRASVGRNRYEHGIWLRRLFMDAGLQQSKAMDMNAKGGGEGEMSDRTAQKRRDYVKAIRDLGVYGPATTAVVCYDQIPKTAGASKALKQGLDLLCDKRS